MGDNVNILDVSTVRQSELPAVISTQFNNLTELENNVQAAVNLAAKAKAKAQSAQVSAGWFKKKAAIELLQEAVKGSAEAQISLADAQKLSFEYQTKLTEITKFLFGLGVSNLAMNRSVIRELELKLKGASEEEISDLARQELRNVILQLKAQEDIMQKQEFLTSKVKDHADQLQYIDKQIGDIEEVDIQQDERITANAKKLAKKDIEDEQQDRKISENATALAEHDEELEQQKQKDAEHDLRFAEKDVTDKQQDDLLERHSQVLKQQVEKDEEFEKMFAEQDIEDKQQDQKIAKNQEKINLHEEKLEQQQQSHELLQQQLYDLHKNFEKEIETLKENIDENNAVLTEKIDFLENDVSKSIEDLIVTVTNNKENSDNTSEQISERIDKIEVFINKKIWKIIVSAIAGISLALNILQIIGVF